MLVRSTCLAWTRDKLLSEIPIEPYSVTNWKRSASVYGKIRKFELALQTTRLRKSFLHIHRYWLPHFSRYALVNPLSLSSFRGSHLFLATRFEMSTRPAFLDRVCYQWNINVNMMISVFTEKRMFVAWSIDWLPVSSRSSFHCSTCWLLFRPKKYLINCIS